MGDNEELSVDQETVDQKVDQPEIGDEPQPQNSTDDFDPKKHTRVQTGANGELCFQGLTQAEVEARIADGQVNAIQDSSNRSVKDIVMGNTLTFFNFINIVLLALVLSVRSYKNMLFIFIIIANTLIGIFQEIKAKITLDKLKILTVSHVDVIRDGVKKSITVSELVKDDVILLKSGGQIPADGVILDGEVDVNESLLTGESDSIHKTCGSKVLSGSFVTSGKAMCLLTEVGHDCYMEKLSSEAKQFKRYKTELQRNLDTILKFISIIIVPLGIILFAKQYWISGSTYEQAALDTVAAVLGMIPEGLVLLTSVALALGAVRLARRSTLVRELFCIETLARVDTLCLDKTGTITRGEPKVTDLIPADGMTEHELLFFANALEKKSEHPLARAILAKAEENGEAEQKSEITQFQAVPGNGLSGKLGEDWLYGGNFKFISDKMKISASIKEQAERLAQQGKTPLFFGRNEQFLGMIAVADVIKEDSPQAVKELQNMGIHVVMLTGDNERTAKAIGEQAGVDEVIAGVLPEGKEQVIRKLKEKGKVAMVGDGINDAPALTRADMGIAIGAGTDIAIDAADVVLMKSRLSDVPAAIRMSRATLRNIHENLFWAFFYNAIGIPLAAGIWIPIFGWKLNPMFGAAAMSLSSFCVVTNALRLNLFKMYDASKDRKRKMKKVETAENTVSDIVLADKNESENKEETKMTKTMKIEGMMCGHCEAAVKKALEALEQVDTAEVSHEAGTAVVTLNSEISNEVLKKTVEDKDYTVTAIED